MTSNTPIQQPSRSPLLFPMLLLVCFACQCIVCIAMLSARATATNLNPSPQTAENADLRLRVLDNSYKVLDHVEKYAWSKAVPGNLGVSGTEDLLHPSGWTQPVQIPLRVVGIVLVVACGCGFVAWIRRIGPEITRADVAVFAGMLLVSGIGWVAIQKSAPTFTGSVRYAVNDYDAFLASIHEQQTINMNQGDPNINDMVDCPEDARFTCTREQFAKIAANPRKYWFNYAFTARWHGGGRYLKCTYVGEDLNAKQDKGRRGQSTQSVVTLGRYLNPVWQWTIQPLP